MGVGRALQYSCLENPRDGGASWAAISGAAQSRTRLKQLSSSREVTLGQESECQQSIRDEITGNADARAGKGDRERVSPWLGRLPLWTAKV